MASVRTVDTNLEKRQGKSLSLRDPVCGMVPKSDNPKALSAETNSEIWFCSNHCREKYNKSPELYRTKTDPVCGMAVARETAPAHCLKDGEAYFFCSEICLQKFEADPLAYGHEQPENQPGQEGGSYTCPMDPEIIQEGPGTCPICGMALEPMGIPSADAGPDPELVDFTRCLLIAAPLSLFLLITEMAQHLLGIDLLPLLTQQQQSWLQLCLATPVVLWCGLPFFVRGWASVKSGHLNMFTLIAAGTGTAFLYSLFAVLAPGLFPSTMVTDQGIVANYFESAAVITTLVLLGQVLELRARERTGDSIRALLNLAPETAHRILADGSTQIVPLEEIRVGDQLRVPAGEKIPTDGIVVDGTSAVDESLLTGEPLPVDKMPGAELTAGTLNGTGTFVMEVRRTGEETTLSRIVAMVAEAQRTRAPVQNLADRVAGWFVPAVITISVIAFLSWMFWGPPPALGHALIAAVSVLIIACPCALGLATPLSVMVATGRGAHLGVLVKNAEYLERLAGVDAVILDKTGTLTEGRPTLTKIISTGSLSDAEVLKLAASLEQGSIHPLAMAIVSAAQKQNIVLDALDDFLTVAGKGVQGTVNGQHLLFGNEALLEANKISTEEIIGELDDLRQAGNTVMFLAINQQLAAILAVSDPVRETTQEAIRSLQNSGLNVIMATGDHGATARSVASELEIGEVHAEILPAGKKQLVEDYQARGVRVAMVGDGINDAPALAQADVGIAIGSGADVAVESAGITLIKGDLRGVVRARRLALATMSNIRQNLFLAFVYNALGVPIAAGLLYPVFGIVLSPMIAAAAMSLSSLSVVSNALRLQRQSL